MDAVGVKYHLDGIVHHDGASGIDAGNDIFVFLARYSQIKQRLKAQLFNQFYISADCSLRIVLDKYLSS